MKFGIRRPEKEFVCSSCKTVQSVMIPVIEFDVFGEKVKWTCSSCLAKDFIKTFLVELGIADKYSNFDTLIDNLKYLNNNLLQTLASKLKARIDELENEENE